MATQPTTGTIEVLNPTVAIPEQSSQLAERLSTLAGVRLGLLSNSKPMADIILEASTEPFAASNGVEIKRLAKPYASRKHDEDELRAFAEECDAVVTALGD